MGKGAFPEAGVGSSRREGGGEGGEQPPIVVPRAPVELQEGKGTGWAAAVTEALSPVAGGVLAATSRKGEGDGRRRLFVPGRGKPGNFLRRRRGRRRRFLDGGRGGLVVGRGGGGAHPRFDPRDRRHLLGGGHGHGTGRTRPIRRNPRGQISPPSRGGHRTRGRRDRSGSGRRRRNGNRRNGTNDRGGGLWGQRGGIFRGGHGRKDLCRSALIVDTCLVPKTIVGVRPLPRSVEESGRPGRNIFLQRTKNLIA